MQFKKSAALTFGMELEFQIVGRKTGKLSPSGMAFWDAVRHRPDAERFSLEATLATIEMNTSVHADADAMAVETAALTQALCDVAAPLDLLIRGGGTQLTQFWNDRVMAPTGRAEELTNRFGYLPKRFSTYGMHVHIGAPSADAAIQMGNVLQAAAPLFIAMSAASPFLQLTDTGYCAARPLEPLIYPHGGPMPRLKDWQDFEAMAEEVFSTQLADSLKDIYWDVRPKPEFGTIEVRVFDTPLSIHKAVALAAFTRACAGLALRGDLILPTVPLPRTAERVSRFLACRDGMDANLFDVFNQQWIPARDWLEQIMRLIVESPVSEIDNRHIRALLASVDDVQDCQIMRDAWSAQAKGESQASSLQECKLAGYSQELATHLFRPIRR